MRDLILIANGPPGNSNEEFAVDVPTYSCAAHNAFGERKTFRIALSGGKTPIPIYTRLAAIGMICHGTWPDYIRRRALRPPDDRQKQLQDGPGTLSRTCRNS